MLNPFPSLLTFALAAPALMRVVAGFIFINLGAVKFRGERERWIASFGSLRLTPPAVWVGVLAIIEIIGGFMLLAGFFTQIAALIFSVITLVELLIEYRTPPVLPRTLPFYLLLFAVSLSLLFSGAGLFAVDLPL